MSLWLSQIQACVVSKVRALTSNQYFSSVMNQFTILSINPQYRLLAQRDRQNTEKPSDLLKYENKENRKYYTTRGWVKMGSSWNKIVNNII